MSLLQAIKEAEAVVASLKALLGGSVAELQDEPWYLHIPKEGVECWIGDTRTYIDRAVGDSYCSMTTVYSYEPSSACPFEANTSVWTYAIPVDPKLRLPNGAITL